MLPQKCFKVLMDSKQTFLALDVSVTDFCGRSPFGTDKKTVARRNAYNDFNFVG
jgi:hypothetical protein